jgi:hypothetical protein
VRAQHIPVDETTPVGPATDDEIADALIALGDGQGDDMDLLLHEAARRLRKEPDE